MQLKSLIATIILGSTSIAAASPSVRDHRHSTTTTSSTTTVVSANLSASANGGVVVTPAPVVDAPVPSIDKRLAIRGELHLGADVRRPMPPIYRPVPAPTWITLANNASLHGRASIDLHNMKRQFSKLELRAEGRGRIAIDRVMIVFGNGQRQIMNLDTKLSKQRPSLAIDLKGETRAIDRIIIVGKTSGRAASLDVLAL